MNACNLLQSTRLEILDEIATSSSKLLSIPLGYAFESIESKTEQVYQVETQTSLETSSIPYRMQVPNASR